MMLGYSVYHWLFFFYFYCFCGWCFETAFVSLKSRRWVNRGFMRGPFLPLYGSGAMMMLVVSMPFQDSILLTYLSGFVGATALEYITGVIMEALFQVRYWDYSSRFLNYKGHICLRSSLVWGVFTVGMTRVVHGHVEAFAYSLPVRPLHYGTVALTVCIVADFTLAFKAALDLRDLLVRIMRKREELMGIQKRLDVFIAFVGGDKEQKRADRSERRELWLNDLSASLEQRFTTLKEAIMNVPSAYGESVREEIAELRGKFSLFREREKSDSQILDTYKRDIILGNPSMRSEAYESAFEELKKIANDEDEAAHPHHHAAHASHFHPVSHFDHSGHLDHGNAADQSSPKRM